MTKYDLINTLRRETDLTRAQAIQVVKLFSDQMSKALASGERVEIRGLCSFHVRSYKGYTG